MNRRAFLAIGALALGGLSSGCSSILLKERHYMEEVSSILISRDEKKLVIITKDYHYVLDAPLSIAITLRSKFHRNVFGEFGEFRVNSSGEISGKYVLKLSKYSSPQERHEALTAGYGRQIDGSISIEGELKGQRYGANGIQANTEAQKLNRTYWMSVVEEPSKLVESSKALLTPIYQGAEGVLSFLVFVTAGGLNSTVAVSLELIHIGLSLF
ncbi:MAG: hypothetical protein ACXWTG_05870 [Methylosarcina sp.]